MGFCIGLVFPVSALLMGFMLSAANVSVAGVVRLHQNNPLLYIVDTLPLVGGLVAYLCTLFYERKKRYFNKEIRERDEKINKHAEFAQQIGKGNYEAILDVDTEDVLGKSLLVMRDNLLENYRKETEENWISQGKDMVSKILRLHTTIDEAAGEVLVNLINYVQVIQGAIYIYDEDKQVLTNTATYAYDRRKIMNQEFKIGEGLIGECAYEMDIIYRTEIPENYATITSGLLGEQKPQSILIAPLIGDEKLQGVLEFASLQKEIPEITIRYLKEIGEIIGRTIFNLKVNQKTEQLLEESRQKTKELQESEEQLRQNAEQMRITQEKLSKSNEQLEAKIKEVENAQNRLNSLLENAFEIIYIYDENKNLTYVSPSVTQIIGFSIEEMKSGKDTERLSKKGKEEFTEMLDTLLEDPGKTLTKQYAYLKKDGEKLFLETTGRNLLNDPAINGIILNSRDITARKRAEKEERLRSRMQSLSENSMDMIVRFSVDGECYYGNPIVKEYFGLTPEQIMNKRLQGLDIPEVFINYFRQALEEIKDNPVKKNTEMSVPSLNESEESERIINVDAIPEFNENELETVLFVGHDITEAKRIESEIHQKNKKIEDSINYAQRIQGSILPDNKNLREVFPSSFIYYQPKDVISGDFPWLFRKEDQVYVAAIDCTGHGVPGALLSFVGYFTFNNIVDHDKQLTAGEIMDQVHYNVQSTLNQDQPDAYARDGMDVAFCKIDMENRELQYSGAHRPLYLLRQGELQKCDGDKKAIGGIPHYKKIEQKFTNHVIHLQKGDKIFFFSDGLPDQIGGEHNKKYSPKRIRETLTEHPDYTMTQYFNHFKQDFENWRGNNKQIDDVLLIGIEF